MGVIYTRIECSPINKSMKKRILHQQNLGETKMQVIKINSIPSLETIADGYHLNREGQHCWITNKFGNIITGAKQTTGYFQIHLKLDNGSMKAFLVHRIYALAFIENENGYRCIDHIDDDRSNNSLSNLQWVSHKMNSMKMVEKKRHSKNGFDQKLSVADVLDIFVKYHKLGMSQELIAEKHNVNYVYIGRILRGQARQNDIQALKEMGMLDFLN